MDMALGVWEPAGDFLLIGFYMGLWIGMGGCMSSRERERRVTYVRDLYSSVAWD